MATREALLAYAKDYCNNTELTDEGGFSVALDSLEALQTKAGISSESVGEIAVSYGDVMLNINKVLSPYIKLKML